MGDTLNSRSWELIFKKLDILSQIDRAKMFRISSSLINNYRESRLMTKFDHRFQLPKIFSENNLSLLPVSRGEYIISDFEIFKDFDLSTNVPIEEVPPPTEWESLNFKDITSEASAINCAYIGGLLNDFLDESTLVPTVNGRMSSLEFNFTINNKSNIYHSDIYVRNSQIEIDGGFEGMQYLSLIEAKNAIYNDFIIRQLYYPYRLWKSIVNKPVKNIFLTYTNGVFHFREYVFTDLMNYNSISLTKEKKYRFSDSRQIEFNIEYLYYLIDSTPVIDEVNIPFPQADSFDRIINLCEVIHSAENGCSKDELLLDFSFTGQESIDPRQVDYYTNAAAYLGFICKSQREDATLIYVLTSRGINLFKLTISERQIEYVKAILEHQIFHNVLKEILAKSESLSKEKIVSLMKSSNLYKVKSDSTYYRRASTITAWIDWILSQLDV